MKRTPRWLWFLAGFLLVFIGTALALNIYPMHASGQFAQQCKLWEYYIIEIRRAFQSSRAIGPAGDGTSAGMVLVQHLLCAAAGGVIALGIRWLVLRVYCKHDRQSAS